MKKAFFVSMLMSLGVLFFASSVQAQNDPSLKLKDPSSLDWFKEAKFGMFIHWGLYSEFEGSYRGKTHH